MTPRQLIEDHYAASARGDLDGMLAKFAPTVEWTEMAGFPYAGTYRGVDEIRAGVFHRLGKEWSDYQAVPDEIVDAGDHVIAFGTYSGTFAATGKHMRARFVHHWTVQNGQIVRFEQFTDTHLVHRAMVPSPR